MAFPKTYIGDISKPTNEIDFFRFYSNHIFREYLAESATKSEGENQISFTNEVVLNSKVQLQNQHSTINLCTNFSLFGLKLGTKLKMVKFIKALPGDS